MVTGTAAGLQPAHLVLRAEATRGIFHTAHWGKGDLPHVLPQNDSKIKTNSWLLKELA